MLNYHLYSQKVLPEYVYSKNAFDSNFVGSIAGCMIIFVAIVSAATVAIGFAEYFAANDILTT